MAVHKRAYKPYDGPLTSERWRFLVLPRYALQELLESRVIVAFLVLCFIPFLAETGTIYLASVPAARALLGISEDQNPFRIGADFFLLALTIQGAASFFLTAWIGPVLVSPDLANGALPLYLSRPFSRVEYVLGKAMGLIALLSLITWVQGLILFSLHAGLVGRDWLFSNLRIAGAIFVGAWIWIAVLTLLGLAFSAWIKWRLVATGALFAVFFGGAAFSEVWREVLRNSWGRLVHLPYLIQIVWRDLFDSASILGRSGRDLPTWAACAGLLAVCLLCVRLLSRRLQAREVVP